MSETVYTEITFDRKDLYEVCKLGFMAVQVGKLTCRGYMLTERLPQLTVAYCTI